MPKRKIKIPSRAEREIEVLQADNADLWYENFTVKSELEETQTELSAAKQEIADLWYVSLTGGM